MFYDCDATTITNCRFDNPTNIYARGSTAVLNGTYAPGTTIAGGPYLGGNLWLNDTAQNISEWGADADFDGICDQALTITGFGTDALPLVYGGTVQINATPADAFVFVDDTNTTRTANRTFYLKVGGHTVSVQKDGVSSEVKEVAIVPGENDPLTFALREPVEHPTDWYVSKVGGDENLTSLLEIPDLGAGDTVHVWGVAGHTYEGGVVINASNVTVKRWEGSPVQPLITSASTTAPAFSVNADNTTFLDLNISRNRLDFDRSSGAGINAVGTYDDPLQRLTITNCTFTGNAVNGTGTEGGALYARFVADLLVEGTTFADNTADYGGGACIRYCTAATLPGTTLADNTAQFGGGLFVQATDNLLVEGTGFTGNTAEFGGGASIENCNAATFTDITLADNSATYNGGGADFMGSDGVTLTNATVTGNTAESGCGGGACFDNCQNPTFTGTTLAGNTARYGGGAYFGMCTNALLTGTALTGNTATDGGGGAYFYDSTNATLTNCRFDNPTNIYAYDSTAAALNGTYAPGTTIAGGPFLGGNLWLNDTAQNISEWGTDADFDGICDENLTINNSDNSLFGTDHLPLIYGGTVQINATPSADGAFVFVDDTNTTRTANRTFYLRVGNHTVSVQKDGVSSATKRVTIAPGENDPLSFDLNQSVEHPTDWYVSKVGGDENLTSLLDIPDLGEGDTVHVWGVAGHTYEGGVVINASNVTVTRWEGSPVQPLITSAPYTAPAFTVNADNTTFLDLNISRNRLRSNYDDGAGINARGAYESHLKRLAITNCTFTGNAVEGKNAHGGALYAEFVDDILVEGATFTGNTAKDGCGGGAYFVSCTAPTLASTSFNNNAADRFGGGAHFFWCTNALLTTTTFTDNTATDGGGGAYFYDSTNATLTTTTLTGNTATNGGGASFRDSKNATVTNCRFDNPTNIYAKSSTAAALNGTYAPGTNIAGGPNLGGNLWLNDTAQNISEWGADADFDGICDETLTITGFGTDALPLIYGGTVQINATPSDAFVFVDDTNTTRTANRTFYLPVGNRTVFVQKDGVSSEVKEVAIVPGENDPLSFTLTEPVEHPTDWYISKVVGGENLTSLLDIPDLGAGDTVHIWGVAGHAYDSGTVIDAPNVTVKRWEGSPVQPLITNISGTTPAFSVTADNATFRDLNISRNQLNGKGAAINASGAYESHLQHLTIADCTFDGNMADQAGGALSAWYVDDLLVEGAVFTDNTASNHGGGAYFNNCQNPTLTTTAFANNSATYNGGGAEFYSCEDAALTAITFINNTAPYGGGACFWYSEDATLTNTTFTDNKASQYGGGAFFIFSINAVYTNTTFADNKAGQYGGGAFIYICDAATLTGTALTGNNATEFGGGAFIYKSRNATLTGTALTGNTADEGGGAYFMSSPNATLTNATFTGNTADEGGGAYFMSSPNATLTTTALTGNTADEGGGGAYFNESHNATIVNCRLDNPTNIYAYESTAAALNGTYAPGTTIAGGPYLGGNLWLNGTDQNLSEWGADVDCDGICDETLTITGFGTDELPLVDGGNRGTALIRASAYGGFVYVDGVNTTRTADSFAPVPRAVVRADDPTPPSDAFFIPAGTHTIEIVGPMTYGRASVDLLAGTTERVTVEVNEVDIEGYAAPRQGPAPLNVSFDTECTDPWPDRLVWTFGDGDESNPCPGPSHVYEKAGTYTATLTAAWGETSDLVTLVRTVEIVVGMSEPLLILSATEGNAPFTLDVNVSSGGTPERWDLDLGDGRQVNGTSPAEINRSVTYDTPGTYPITLTVSTGEVTNATTRTVTVLAPPVAAFDLSPREGNAPLDVGFTDTSTGDITAWSWDFGDGATSTDPSPTHRYERGGTYTVQLTVSNAYGSSTAEQSVVVSTPGPGGRSSPSSGGGSTTSAGSAGTILAGDTASLVLHDSAIYEVRVTAAETIPKVMVTIGKTARPSGVEAPAGTVYEYDEVTLYHTTEDAIEGALLLFKVPKTWLEEHGLTPADVVLYRYHDDEWQALPNEVVREDETFWHFSAKSAGFSLFAIGGDPSPVETPVMTPGAPVETPAPITPSPPAAGPTPAGTEPPFLMMVLVVAAAVALFVVGMVVWRRR
ncbi:PGF-pre-PGF domain-containing protein [Methanofollis sp. W23]|nr:PGF-pre-PGF domain-containing protein [Methanofollis sp. W23]